MNDRLSAELDTMGHSENDHERAVRAEQLLKVMAALAQATNERDILTAVALYAEQVTEPGQPLPTLTLKYADVDDADQLTGLTTVARRKNGRFLDARSTLLGDEPIEALRSDLLPDHDEEVAFIEDASSSPLARHVPELWHNLSAQSGVYMPLFVNARWRGIIVIQWAVPRQFSDWEKYVYRAIRQSVAAVVASRRAYLAELEARKERELLFQTSAAINAATAFDEIAEAVSKLNFTDGEIDLLLFDDYDYEGAMYFQIAGQAQTHRPTRERWLSIEDVPLIATHTGQGVFANEDIPNNPTIDDVSRATFARLGVQSTLGVCLTLKQRWMGILIISHATPRHYTAQEKRLLEGIRTLVESAVERIRLRQETEAARERAEHLAKEAQKVAALEERNRLARELHDSVSQALYGIALGARTARKLLDRNPAQAREPLDYVLSLAEAGLIEMRALIFDLRPDALAHEGLVAALEKQAKSIQARHGIAVTAQFGPEPSASDKIKEEVYRVVREALHNAVKHARATQLTIKLASDGSEITAEVMDNGAGFDIRDSFPGHFGLKSMWERARKLGGSFDIQSELGKGTVVQLRLPVIDEGQ